MLSGKSKILVGFLIYGVTVGLLSFWWWSISDSLFLLNIPGELIGYQVYDIAIRLLGDPFSPQAHYSISWVLRIPQVFVPVSTLFWGVTGLGIQTAYIRLTRRRARNVPTKPDY
jgi:hypothetical protein